MAEGGSNGGLSTQRIERLRVRLAVGPRCLVSRVEARFLFPGRDSAIDGICAHLPYRLVDEDGAPLYEYAHIVDAMPLLYPEGAKVPPPAAPAPAAPKRSRVPMEEL